MSVKNNAKYLTLCEAVLRAIKDGKLAERLDVLKLQAAELGIEGQDFDTLIEEQKQAAEKGAKDVKAIGKHKTLIYTICLAAIVAEWVIGVRGGISLGTVIWLLLANLITSLVVIFGVSFILNKK